MDLWNKYNKRIIIKMEHLFYYIRNIFYIIEGYIKWIYDKISGRESERAKKRYSICMNCEHNSHGICK